MEPALGHHQLEVHTFETYHFTYLGFKNKTYFSKFYLKFLACKNALKTSEHFQKSTHLEPAVGHHRVEVHTFDNVILHT